MAVPQAARLPRRARFFHRYTLPCKVLFFNRIIFLGTWTTLVTALFIYPGFEIRGLAMGLIIGCGPVLLFSQGYYQHPFIQLLAMFLISGLFVLLCAWLMDKAKIRWATIFLTAFMLAGAAWCASRHISFETWKHTPAISAAIESPEVSYRPTRWDFNKTIVIPQTIAGALWGLYLAAGTGALLSTSIFTTRIIRKPKSTPKLGDSHGRRKY
ncbi:hypothetical protein P4C99_12895 [Pontiellaceae bacterium B1224]|nr:hypothetical protein [Pontiellaceae bacterium B1224]